MTGAIQVSSATHEQLAKQLFNKTWDYLDMRERAPEDEINMIHCAHASRYHWGVVGEALQLERGEWQVSRVYSVLGRSEPALYHAKKCLEICRQNGIGDFDIAFAYEALARAHGLAGDHGNREKYLELAKGAGEKIEAQGNKDYFFSELKTA